MIGSGQKAKGSLGLCARLLNASRQQILYTIVYCREERGAYRGGGGDERNFDRRRPQYDRGGPGRYSAGAMDRDRDFYGGPPDDYGGRGPGPNGGGGGSRGRGASVGESPEYPGGGGRRMSRGMSPDDNGAPLSKVMFIKRMIDEDLPEQEIDRRCAYM